MAKIKAKTTKPMTVAYIEHIGPYSEVPWEEYMERLYGWAKEHHVRPGFSAIGIYHDNPEDVQPEACRSEVAIPIHGDASSDGGVKVKELPAMRVAELTFKGPSTMLGDAYRDIMAWTAEHGCEAAGPSMEIYRSRPKIKKGKMIFSARIQVPITEQ